jgi:hypothetical protein
MTLSGSRKEKLATFAKKERGHREEKTVAKQKGERERER